MRNQLLKNLSWVAVFAMPVVAAGSPEHPRVVLFALTFATSAAVTLAVLNGRATRRRPVGEPLSHVRPVDEPSELEDLLRLSWWQTERARLDNLDAVGRTLKVGVDVHAGMCWDGHRIVCICGLADREATGGAA